MVAEERAQFPQALESLCQGDKSAWHIVPHLQQAGGTEPYTWSLTRGALPGGVSLNSSTGVVSGTPTAAVTGNLVSFGLRTPVIQQRKKSVSLPLRKFSAAGVKRDHNDVARGDGERGVLTATGCEWWQWTYNWTLTTPVTGFALSSAGLDRYATNTTTLSFR